jgi:hypothetical protein
VPQQRDLADDAAGRDLELGRAAVGIAMLHHSRPAADDQKEVGALTLFHEDVTRSGVQRLEQRQPKG